MHRGGDETVDTETNEASGKSELSPILCAMICAVYLVKTGKEYLGI